MNRYKGFENFLFGEYLKVNPKAVDEEDLTGFNLWLLDIDLSELLRLANMYAKVYALDFLTEVSKDMGANI